MMKWILGLIWIGLFWTLVACQPQQTPETAVSEQSSALATNTASPIPSLTPHPTATPEPSRTARPSPTPKPSPTLPAGEVFDCLPSDGDRVSGIVAGVIDGDTITVQVGVQSFTIRYIGMDTPETNVVPAERMGLEAKSRNRELVSGRRVILVADPVVGNTDRYNRLLRYVIVDGTFVNVQLVREGLAHYYAGETSCGKTVFAAEVAARADTVGLWAPEVIPTP